MNNVLEQQTVYPLDAELGGHRLFVPIIFIGLWVVGYFIFTALIPSAGLNLIAVLLGFGVAYGVTTLAERQMKQRWPSGRNLVIDSEGVHMMRKQQTEQVMRADQQVNHLLWRFTVTKRTRVAKGWFMLACALEYEDNFLTVYTFMSPKDFEQYRRSKEFPQLTSKKEMGKNDLRMAGEQRRLRLAENHRWMSGAEMTVDDFKRYLEEILSRFPEWMPIQ